MEDRPIKKKKTEVHGGQNVELPPEIIDAILLRLPVKPLCRFKLVSKSWQSLISHPDFVANHSKAAVENKDRRRLFINILSYSSPFRLYSLNFDQFHGDGNLVAASTELDFWAPSVHCSCYGLFLTTQFAKDNCYCLINPVTKESKKLPKPPIWTLPLDPSFPWVYALGFDHSTNEYKVIHGQEYDDGLVFSVYTLQTGSWRKIDDLFPYKSYGCLDGIMVNGHVHWLARKVTDGSLVIISFLLPEEKVREIALPPNASNDCIQLGAFRDWLCVTSTLYIAIFNEFWVMKKYGMSKSWTKMRVSKPYKDLSHSGFWTETHDLMVFDKELLVMYNFNDDKFWTLSIGEVQTIRSIGSYVETLATLTHRSRTTSSKEDDSDIIEY
ncbi:PREDICTED: F-box/kelch-repeat protein At3g06240-like [Fragaria vesca subsp. vesca]|uniref:F-box/kelch-repeat protein At3g06240-like n=1 Tax=Fragaria vesca subsp. vesca TaxID=101020 RepID=UPI0002C2EB21|nr:PREDICTED: F-box/kelch-repeat protein At3g06240-like [Fragaria vesca subsp. vesca]XP_004309274.1 PREDICTED: F-box/kelch-repeat protein At3g06240-like [Fragaria vesca subsp. vesca]